jgi:hypothetical protein
MRRNALARRFRVMDSTLAYFINQLQNFDPRLYEPLVSVSWGRDIKLRSGITMSNESTSFIQSAFAAAGTLGNSATNGGIPWISAETTAIPGVSVNGKQIVLPLRLAARQVNYTSVELERSQLTQQPIDVQKVNALNILYQMNVDQMVYVGDTQVGATGLLNSGDVTATTVATGVAGSTAWSTKTPDEILADVNTLLTGSWSASAYAVCPSKLLLPPTQFGFISTQKVSSAGNVSILKYLRENSISLEINGSMLDIQPVKWLPGLGVAGDTTNRMVVYTNSEDRVRYPMVPIRRETAYYQGIQFFAPYLYALGEMEFPYPETLRYGDGI